MYPSSYWPRGILGPGPGATGLHQQDPGREVRIAIADRLTTDTLSSPIDSISGAVVTLSAGEGVKWSRRDVVNLGLVGGNPFHVASVVGVTGDDVTLSIAPGSASSPGDTMGGGFAEWVRPAAGDEQLIYSIPRQGIDPGRYLTSTGAGPACVVRVGPPLRRGTSMHRRLVDVAIRVQGRDTEWWEGCQSRVLARLTAAHAALAALLPAGWLLWELSAPAVAPVVNDSGLLETEIQLSATLAPAVAA